MTQRLSRRAVLRAALGGTGLLLAGRAGSTEGARAANPGTLGEPDANGLRLPAGYSGRIVARAGEPPAPASPYTWHPSPDGGACFATSDGGWIYVSNSEFPARLGGVGALRFDADGNLRDAYSICSGTSLNCAGGATPWNTWLSCEEHDRGLVWECDPFGQRPAVARPALGTFKHEAVAADVTERRLYLTEDTGAGGFYRFTPAGLLPSGAWDLSTGVLEIAEIREPATGAVVWHRIPDPAAGNGATSRQVAQRTPFSGGEGIAVRRGTVFFATKGDTRIWAYDTRRQRIGIYYDDDAFADPVLTDVDNVAISPAGDVLVAEDGGDMQLVAITPHGVVHPLLQVVGHRGSELAGPAFDPSGTRLYISSQRGPGGYFTEGITFEITGPFASA